MKSLWNKITGVEKLEAEVKSLTEQLTKEREKPLPPSFVEVAKPYKSTELAEQIEERVIDDLAPILRGEVLELVLRAFADQDFRAQRDCYVSEALDVHSGQRHVRVELQRAGTHVQVV